MNLEAGLAAMGALSVLRAVVVVVLRWLCRRQRERALCGKTGWLS